MSDKEQAMRGESGLLAPLLAAASVTLAGCVGPALLQEPLPLELSIPVAAATDERILASIDAVIVRNGPGTWVRDAEWDEYLIRIRALSDATVQVRGIAVFDALQGRVEPRANGKSLLEGTRETRARYAQAGKPGPEGTTVPAVFLSANEFAVLLLPLVMFDAVVGGHSYRQVDNEIQRRRTRLPVAVPGGGEKNIDLFFPRTPLPRRAEVVYVDRHGEHRLVIDMRDVLAVR